MNSHAVDFPSIILCICHQDNRFEPNFVCNTHHWKPDTFTKKKNISRRRICFTLRRQQTYTTKAAVLAWLNTTKSLSIMNFKRLENETHHHVLKLSIELLKLGGKFLSGKADGISVNRGFTQQQHADLVHSITVHGLLKKIKFTSHVWLSLLTAGLLIPMMMAKNELRFLNSRQLQTDTHKQKPKWKPTTPSSASSTVS